MKNLIKATIIVLVLSLTPLFAAPAGAGHSHLVKEVSKSTIQNSAKQHLLKLVKDEKIDKSWSSTSIAGLKKKLFGQNKEWVVDFKNSQIKDDKKQTLYIFVDLYGKITGANYTGK